MGNTLPWLSNDTEVDHARPTICPSAAVSALEEALKMQTISRAKRSAAWACSAATRLVFSKIIKYYRYNRYNSYNRAKNTQYLNEWTISSKCKIDSYR